MNEKRNKIKGCLIGVAAGDAMGMPSSMMSPEEIVKRFGKIDSFLPAPVDHLIHHGMVAGEVTDDTQQTLAIADSILEIGTVDPMNVAKHLIKWGEDLGIFNSDLAGPSTMRALGMIRNGKSIDDAGKVGDTNGACMRIASVGVFGKGELERTVDAVSKSCKATHNTNIAIAGASAIAMVIGSAINGEKDVDILIRKAREAVEAGMKRGNIWYSASILKRIDWVMDLIETAESKEKAMIDIYNYIGAGVQISETVPTCLGIVKLADGDPVETVRIAANLGGDCDTIGAIAGSMAGAIGGANAFPREWIEKLEKVNNIDFSFYAEKLYNLLYEE